MLAGLGIVSFVIMLVGTVVSLLLPHYKDLAMAGWAPGIVFEAAIGVWLLLNGIRTAPATMAAPQAATGSASR